MKGPLPVLSYGDNALVFQLGAAGSYSPANVGAPVTSAWSLTGGTLPPRAQWGHIALMALFTGAIATYHAMRPSPTVPAAKSITVTEEVKS